MLFKLRKFYIRTIVSQQIFGQYKYILYTICKTIKKKTISTIFLIAYPKV